jgi:heme A synthase
MVQKQQLSGGMVQQQQFSARRKQGSAWVLVGIAALAAVAGLMVAGTNAYLASDPWNLEPQRELFTSPKGSLKHELDMGRAPVATVQLTPDLVRALLTLDEKAKTSLKSRVVTSYTKRTRALTFQSFGQDQLALVVDPKTEDEVARQREVMALEHRLT